MENDIASLPLRVSPQQAARLLNISTRTIQRECERGKIKAVKIASCWRIDRDSLLEYAGFTERGAA